jgi:LuxR family maltose regulon positive regulatory protein
MLDEPVDSATSAALKEKTEGWITGLRLAALALRHRSDRNHIMTNLPEESRYLTDYLIALVYNFKSIIFWIGKSNL